MSYFGMHNHTYYSNVTTGLDCMNSPQELVDTAISAGLSGIAITDHDNLSAVVEINKIQKQLAKDNINFTLAFGNEIYLINEWDTGAEDFQSKRRRYYHFILVALDEIGFKMLKELSSRAWYRSAVQRGRRRVPTLYSDIEEVVREYGQDHLVAATACLGSYFDQCVLEERYQDADNFIHWGRKHFGEDNFFLEVQPSDSDDQIKYNKRVLSRYWDKIKFVVTTDSHYLTKDEFPLFEAFLRSTQEWREVQEYYGGTYIQNADEVKRYLALAGYSEAIVNQVFDNTNSVKNRVQSFDISKKTVVPEVQLPRTELNVPNDNYKKYPTLLWASRQNDIQTQYAINTCLRVLNERGLWNETYLSRLEEEFDVYKFQSERLETNFFSYFNTMRRYIDYSWEVGCAVGPSRGSASGSLTCYLMDIVQGDPIHHKLPHWRFLNKSRVDLVDIDTDFAPSRRDALLDKIREERGDKGVLKIATFKKLTLKAAIGNAGRGYRSEEYPQGIDSDIIGYLSSLVEIKRGFVATLNQTLYGDDVRGFNKNTRWVNEVNKYPGLLKLISRMEGVITNSSTHAAGILFFDNDNTVQDNPYIDHVSLMRAPNGDLCSATELHDSEELGALKYDMLLLSTLDIQTACFELLQADEVIDKSLTLKECFQKYIDPNKINYSNPRIWDALHSGNTLSVFQWDEKSGIEGIAAMKPNSLIELSAANGLIRLMSDGDEETQIERFDRIKQSPQDFEVEMTRVGLSKEQKQIMHDRLDPTNGVAAFQEDFMVLSQQLAGYSLAEANNLRKLVAKKQMDKIEKAKEKFLSCFDDQAIGEYIWKTTVEPSLGYSFSRNHSLPYSIIGIQCLLMGDVLFPKIYWQTACLLQRAGALSGKATNYNKIAKAVSQIAQQGVNIEPLGINSSEKNFKLSADNNKIYFGFGGTKGIRTNVIEKIVEERKISKFISLEDFLERVKPDVTSLVALVKARAFDNFDEQDHIINQIAEQRADIKRNLNGQNLLMISRKQYWPQDSEELIYSQRIFNFFQYLKKINFELTDIACDFLDEIAYPHDGERISKQEFKKTVYDPWMVPIKQYLIDNQTEMLKKVNNEALQSWKEKYFPYTFPATGEIETMGLCFSTHPLASVSNIDNFEQLGEEPIIANLFTPRGSDRVIPIYKLNIIAGTVIAKDKLHHSFTLLTPSGPVDVRMRKEQFAHYDKQVSQILPSGKKQVIEKSWLNRGNHLLVQGMRKGEFFFPKKYSRSSMDHTIYKITKIKKDGKVEIQKDRKTGNCEEVSTQEK